MDFFERQDKARRSTRVLVVYFFLAVALTIVALYAALALLFLRQRDIDNVFFRLWDTQLFLGVAAGTLFIILLGSLSKSFELRQGGAAVASMLGGRSVGPNTTDPDERKLRNVVEEMAIASGMPVPEIYRLPEEKGINAFAAGHSPDDAAIGVTDGCMRLLNRDELQGVIGHEFSHILNGDMKLNLQLMGIINGLVFITIIGRQILFASTGMYRQRYYLGARSRGRGGNPLPLIGLAFLVIGSIGVLFARLIKSAVSRQREFLADAAAVQFTRNPGGLSGALKKIGGLTAGSRLQTVRAEQASHMFFGNGLAESWFKLASTHPPLEERIRAIEPAFDGRFPPVHHAARESAAVPPAVPAAAPPHLPVAGLAGTAVGAAAVVARVGEPAAQHLEFAANFRAALPPELEQAAREPLEAAAVVYALLLSADPAVRTRQMQQLEAEPPPVVYQTVQRLRSPLAGLEARFKLPLVSLCLPALQQLSRRQFDEFARRLRQLSECDQEIDLFEYTLQKIVLRHLEPRHQPKRRAVIQYYSLAPLLDNVTVLLSALARIGHTETTSAERAFRAGVQCLGSSTAPVTLLGLADCGLPQIDASLNRLAQASPAIKKTVLTACAQTVAADNVVRSEEAELLRAIGDTLDCPIPPMISGV